MFTKFAKHETGNIAISSAVIILTLLTGIGTAIDVTNVVSLKTSLQDATDIATLAAVNFNINDEDNAVQNSLEIFNLNHDEPQLENTQYTVNFTNQGATGTATADYPLFFASVLPQAKLAVNVKTVVATAEASRNICIKALSETANPGLRINSGAQIIGPDCDIDVHSLAPQALNVNSGIRLDVARSCIAGSNILNNTRNPDIVETDCDVSPDPFANQFPAPNDSCTEFGRVYNNPIINLQPGVYCGFFNFGRNINQVNFAPGVYVIKNGGWTIDSGDWEGDEVTFYFADQSNILFNAAIEARMTPPRTGPYANAFMIEAPNLPPSNVIIDDSRGFDFEGILYLPSRQVIFNSGATIRARDIAIVADTIIINDAVLNLKPITGANTTAASQVYIAQ